MARLRSCFVRCCFREDSACGASPQRGLQHANSECRSPPVAIAMRIEFDEFPSCRLGGDADAIHRGEQHGGAETERKSGVSGESVSGSDELGGHRIMYKTITTNVAEDKAM